MSDIFNMADTWNAGGTTFTAIKMNATNTASAADTMLMDLQVDSSTKFMIRKNGDTRIYNAFTDASNGEWFEVRWASNVCNIGTSNNGTGVAETLNINSNGGTLTLQTGGFDRWAVSANNWVAITDNSQDIGQPTSTRPRYVCAGTAFVLADGVTAPGTTAGAAYIYIDTADGDLKIKFGDGTVKTITVDT